MSSSTLSWRKSNNSSVEILESPRRNEQILPNFYFGPRWRIFVFQRAICRFFRGNSTFMRRNRRNSHVTKVLVLRCFIVLPWQADDPQWGCSQPPCRYKKERWRPLHKHAVLLCDRVGIRTQDLLLRRQLLYPAELLDLCIPTLLTECIFVAGYRKLDAMFIRSKKRSWLPSLPLRLGKDTKNYLFSQNQERWKCARIVSSWRIFVIFALSDEEDVRKVKFKSKQYEDQRQDGHFGQRTN